MSNVRCSSLVLGAVLASACLATAAVPPTTRPSGSGPATRPIPQIKGEVPRDYVEHELGDTGASLRAPPTWTTLPPRTTLPPKTKRVTLADREIGAIVLFEALDPQPDATPAKSLETLEARLRAATPGFRLVSSDVAQLHDQQAQRVVYDAKREGKAPARTYQVLVDTKKHRYMLVCSTSPEAADGVRTVFERMLLSAKFP